MRVTVKLFANEARLAGSREIELELASEAPTAADVRRALAERLPALKNQLTQHAEKAAGKVGGGGGVAVNYEFVDDATVIQAGDEIAYIGQVSGG
ncbi:MAG: MoaD/ThiS family protein [Phycisphaeraceae bacterium]